MTCTACEAATSTGIHLCTDCTLTLEQALDMIDDTIEAAQDTIARLDVIGTGGGGDSAEPTAPISLRPARIRDVLWETVVSWSRWVLAEDQRGERMPSDPVAYLRASANLIRTHDWAGDLLREVTTHHGALLKAIDIPPDVISLGECGAETEVGVCAGTVKGRRGAEMFQCRRCGAMHDVAERQQERISQAWHVHRPLAEVVKALNAWGYDVKLSSARNWTSQGRLAPSGRNERRVALYTPAEVMDAAQRMKSNHGGKRVA